MVAKTIYISVYIYTSLGHSRGIGELYTLPTQSFSCKRYCFIRPQSSMLHERMYTLVWVSFHIIVCNELMHRTWIHEIQQVVIDPWLVTNCSRCSLTLYSCQFLLRYSLKSKVYFRVKCKGYKEYLKRRAKCCTRT